MKKLMDDIIELILDNMDCHHEVDHDEDGTHVSVEYNLNREAIVRIKMRELIEELASKEGDWDNARDAYSGNREEE